MNLRSCCYACVVLSSYFCKIKCIGNKKKMKIDLNLNEAFEHVQLSMKMREAFQPSVSLKAFSDNHKTALR